MVQLVQPDLSVIERAGLCLQFVRRVFGAPKVEDTAWEAWERAKYRHFDRNFPTGVSVPVFFDWSGYIVWSDGTRHWGRYGHVAVLHADGKVYSSPLTGRGRAWFASIDDLVRAFGNGMRYVGWSEDISNVRVVKEEDMARDAISAEEAVDLYMGFVPNQTVNFEWVRKYTGAKLSDAIQAIKNDPSRQAYITAIVDNAAAFEKAKLAEDGPAGQINKAAVIDYLNKNLQ